MEHTKAVAKESKIYFLLGLFAGLAVMAIVAFLAIWSMSFSGKNSDSKGSDKVAVADNKPAPEQQVPTEPTADASKLSAVTKDDYVRGDYNAPVTMILFSDFECPFCLRFEDTLKQVMANYKGKVRLVFRHFPLSFHPEAEKAAEAAECSGEQGKFWEMHDKIFEANKAGTMGVAQWKTDAKALGLKTSQFDSCLDSGKYASKIAADEAEGQAAGVTGTPATFINGDLISGALPYESIKQAIDIKLAE